MRSNVSWSLISIPLFRFSLLLQQPVVTTSLSLQQIRLSSSHSNSKFLTTSLLRSSSTSAYAKPFFHFRSLRRTFSSNLNMSTEDSSPVMKKVKLDDRVSTKVIGTHSGTFQADEAMGVWMLRQIPEYRNAKVVRSRDLEVLAKLDIVIDVGAVYDHSVLRYDHHQRGYDERFDEGKSGKEERCTKLSASGLVYRHYGKDVLKAYYPDLSDDSLNLAYNKVYNSLLEALDAIDTGVEMIPAGVEKVYSDATGLSRRVSRCNPRWNEVGPNGQAPNDDERFEIASAMCGEDFVSVMTQIVESDLPARDFVEAALLKRHEVDSTGEIIVLESGGLPWKNHLYELERVHLVDPLVKFCLYEDQGGMWRVQAVTVEGTAFENRLGLPKEWRGVRDDKLEAVTKIPGSKFVHVAGFIGGNATYEGALKMAVVALTHQ